jgi:hypothetical protein
MLWKRSSATVRGMAGGSPSSVLAGVTHFAPVVSILYHDLPAHAWIDD